MSYYYTLDQSYVSREYALRLMRGATSIDGTRAETVWVWPFSAEKHS